MAGKASRKGSGLGRRFAKWVVGLVSVAAMVVLVGIFNRQEGNAVDTALPPVEGGAAPTPPVARPDVGTSRPSAEWWIGRGEGWFDDDDGYEHDDEWEAGEEYTVRAIRGIGLPTAVERRVFRTRAS